MRKSHNNLRSKMSSFRNYLVEMIFFIKYDYIWQRRLCSADGIDGAEEAAGNGGRWTLLLANICVAHNLCFSHVPKNASNKKYKTCFCCCCCCCCVCRPSRHRHCLVPSFPYSSVELLLWFCANSLGILLEINHCLCRRVCAPCATNEWMSLCALVVFVV